LERPAEELLPSTGIKVLRVPNKEPAREPELPAGGMEEGLVPCSAGWLAGWLADFA